MIIARLYHQNPNPEGVTQFPDNLSFINVHPHQRDNTS